MRGIALSLALAMALALAAVAPASAADAVERGRVQMKPRSCTPKGTKVVERRRGVIYSAGREVWYACAVWVGRSYNLFGPIYNANFAPSDGGCDLGNNVVIGPLRGERVRYRLVCHYSFGVEGSGTIRWRAVLNLRSGWIRYRRKR